MPTWDANRYLQFASERTQPSLDLVARIALDQPRRIIDLGCGPGNSTEVVRRRWPDTDIVGLDSSPAMIEAARQAYPDETWLLGDIATWTAAQPYDLVFSNAALQWLPNHTTLYPRLLRQVAPGGALAVQIPAHLNAPIHQAMNAIAADPAWVELTRAAQRSLALHDAGEYYDMLSPEASRVDLWTTTYYHVLPHTAAIVDWMRGTGLRPYLEALANDEQRAQFEARYLAEMEKAYPAQADGRVLLPFRRLFVVAYRREGE
jgi:trans-aconitate 2-methyltransferase